MGDPNPIATIAPFYERAIACGTVGEKAESDDYVVSQKTYLEQDDAVPSWIGAIVAMS